MEHPKEIRENLRPLIIIAGPTASGKSDAAVNLAMKINGSVISADSMQVYRGMDIGSAKITKEEMKGIPHYLIDIIDPDEEWNVVRFQQEAVKAIDEIYAEGRIPIICGGTGFYIQSLLYAIDFTETSEDHEYRKQLQDLADTKGAEELHRLLREIDPESAEKIHPNNIKRVIRALEYIKETGEPISRHNEEELKRPAAYHAAFFVLTMNRQELYDRIDQRVDRMFDQGLVEEVESLKRKGFTDKDVSMQGLGYKEVLRALDGQYCMEEARKIIKLETRHFAKRQLTWFKRESNILYVDRDIFKTQKVLDDYLLNKTEEILHVTYNTI